MQLMKGIWVGRLDESDGHVVLTHMEQTLDEQCEGELGTAEFSPIWLESSGVVFKIQLRLRPNF